MTCCSCKTAKLFRPDPTVSGLVFANEEARYSCPTIHDFANALLAPRRLLPPHPSPLPPKAGGERVKGPQAGSLCHCKAAKAGCASLSRPTPYGLWKPVPLKKGDPASRPYGDWPGKGRRQGAALTGGDQAEPGRNVRSQVQLGNEGDLLCQRNRQARVRRNLP